MDRLQSTGTIDVGYSRNHPSLGFADLEHLHHERNVIIFLEPFRDMLSQDRWGKRAKGFAAFYLGIQNVAHVGPARIAQNRSIAERSWSPLHPPLEPSDNGPLGDRGCHLATKLG